MSKDREYIYIYIRRQNSILFGIGRTIHNIRGISQNIKEYKRTVEINTKRNTVSI